MKKLIIGCVFVFALVLTTSVQADLFLGFGYRPPCYTCRPVVIYPQHSHNYPYNYNQYNYKPKFYNQERENHSYRSHESDRDYRVPESRNFELDRDYRSYDRVPQSRNYDFQPRNIIINNNYYNQN